MKVHGLFTLEMDAHLHVLLVCNYNFASPRSWSTLCFEMILSLILVQGCILGLSPGPMPVIHPQELDMFELA